MMIVYLSDMCLKKWKQKRVPNIYSKLFFLAVWTGLEPATPCVTGMYSNQLNYQTKMLFFIAIPLNCGAKIGGFFELAIV